MDNKTVTIEVRGVKMTGTLDAIRAIAREMRIDLPTDLDMYYSESKGVWILMSDMSIYHIRNAMHKLYKEWFAGLDSVKEPPAYLAAITEGPTDKTFLALAKHLAVKVKRLGAD